jgi:hypothetical protein
VIERLSSILGTDVRRLTRVRSPGYTVAYHGVAELADGTTVFVKAATEPVTAQFIRDEQRVLGALEGPFLPAVLAMDDEDPPLLVLEDLCSARWPPPWDEAAIAAVRQTLRLVASTTPPDVIPPIAMHRDRLVTGWAEIEASGRHSSRSARARVSGWPARFRSSVRRASRRRSTETGSCTWTSGATTSASPTAARCSWTGTRELGLEPPG